MKRKFMIFVSLLTLLCSCSNSVSSTTTDEELPISNILSQSEDTNDSSIDNNRTYPESGDLVCKVECPAPKPIDDQFKFNVYCAHSWRTEEGDLSYYPDGFENWSYKILLNYSTKKLENGDRGQAITKISDIVVADIPDFYSDKYDATHEFMERTPPYTKDITLKEAIEVELDQSLFKISNEEYGRLTFHIWPFDSNNVEVSAKMARVFIF